MTPPGDRQDAVLREAAHRLADTLAPYRVLTKDKLEELSGEGVWRTVSFERALQWAVDHDVIHRLDPDLYEIPENAAGSSPAE